ncbi:prephenate dehydrogenase/arogenate dehydrogenase family protein [Saccharothrix sp. MB29]|nr:prephenate dehydrogenase/arogenate dehydrogenase family protein [Saccharothrix sp. MB29]
MTRHRIKTLAVVGTGLIGTSIALAARSAGVSVVLEDRDDRALAAAVARGAGVPAAGSAPPADLAVLAVPPDAVAEVLWDARKRRLARFYTDVASTKAEVVRGSGQLPAFVPGHPMAGAEKSGPEAARADMFHGAPLWRCAPGTAPQRLWTPSTSWSRCAGRRRWTWTPVSTTAPWRSCRTSAPGLQRAGGGAAGRGARRARAGRARCPGHHADRGG